MQEPRREHRRRGEAVRAVFLPLPEALHRLILLAIQAVLPSERPLYDALVLEQGAGADVQEGDEDEEEDEDDDDEEEEEAEDRHGDVDDHDHDE